jgi:hypothetical protein
MLTPRFGRCREVRMGSPYNACELTFEGSWVPDLPERSWYDRWARDPEGRYLALVAWDPEGDEPAFRVWVVDTRARTVVVGPRFVGFCEAIAWEECGRFRCQIAGFIWPPG